MKSMDVKTESENGVNTKDENSENKSMEQKNLDNKNLNNNNEKQEREEQRHQRQQPEHKEQDYQVHADRRARNPLTTTRQRIVASQLTEPTNTSLGDQ